LPALTAASRKESLFTYTGFDLTAPSLHVGSLIQIMVVRWLKKTGHFPYILLGDATTRIGDPTGKTAARPILTEREIETNKRGIQQVLSNLVEQPRFVSNAAWFNDQTPLFQYLAEYGPHFSINRMLTFDSVRSRLEAQDSMSFLEFNYMLFQAIDFLELERRAGVTLQIGGSDQWGNIVNGVELVRRKSGETVFGLTTPLMTTSAGEKMGKTANGAVWLDPARTSSFDFWQFWRNVEDAKVGEFLGLFTELPMDEVRRLSALKGGEINEAKKVLASEVTTMVHGHTAAAQAEADAKSVFQHGERATGLPTFTVSLSGGPVSAAELFLHASLVTSKGEADRLAQQGGMKIDGRTIENARLPLGLMADTMVQLAAGKKRFSLVKIID
jgi:tyrosyl-tRNA synthetase